MQNKGKKSVYYSAEKIAELWNETKAKRKGLKLHQSSTKDVKSNQPILGTKRPAPTPVQSTLPQKKKKPTKQFPNYNHYQTGEGPDCVEGEDWEGVGCSHYNDFVKKEKLIDFEDIGRYY